VGTRIKEEVPYYMDHHSRPVAQAVVDQLDYADAPPAYDEISQLRQRNASLTEELRRREMEDMQRHFNEQVSVAQQDAWIARQQQDQMRSESSLRDCLFCCICLECLMLH